MRTFLELLAESLAGTTPGEYGLMTSVLGVAVMVFVGEIGTDLFALFG